MMQIKIKNQLATYMISITNNENKILKPKLWIGFNHNFCFRFVVVKFFNYFLYLSLCCFLFCFEFSIEFLFVFLFVFLLL